AATAAEVEGILHLANEPTFEGAMHSNIVSGSELARWTGGDPDALGRFTGARFGGRISITRRTFKLSNGAVSAPSIKSGLAITSEFGRRLEVALPDGEIYGGRSVGRFELLR